MSEALRPSLLRLSRVDSLVTTGQRQAPHTGLPSVPNRDAKRQAWAAGWRGTSRARRHLGGWAAGLKEPHPSRQAEPHGGGLMPHGREPNLLRSLATKHGPGHGLAKAQVQKPAICRHFSPLEGRHPIRHPASRAFESNLGSAT